ncbi:hypothetical protein LWI29_006664 [Acer saccharum]|uniref:Transmembrane protein n=1 Tax=Acer saccharum TaxID=4024 RepID=A0AA39SU36_ACESA|nr:hypothetical protein LWI29_006664 [Acer saccharum]
MELELEFELEMMIGLELEFEKKKVIVWVIMQMMVEHWTSSTKEVGVVAVAILEDLEDEGLGEVEVGVGMGSVGSVPSASVIASLWVLKMLKIRLKMRVLVYFRARFGNFDFGF